MPAPIPSSISTLHLFLETGMSDVEASKLRKTVKKKKHPQVMTGFKESVGATTITKRVLDLKISLTVARCIASALAIDKDLNKIITGGEAVQFWFNNLE